MLLTTYIRPKRLTWRVTFGLDDLPGGLPRRPEAARGPGRRFAERARGRAIDGVGAVDVGGRRDRRRRAAIASARVASPSSNKNYQQPAGFGECPVIRPFWRAQRLTPGPDDLPYDLQSAPTT